MGDKRARLQKKFDAVEKAGGIKLPNIKTLSFKERIQCTYSIWGFLFSIVYYGYHGVWKKGLSLLAIGLIITLLLNFITMDTTQKIKFEITISLILIYILFKE